MHLLVDISGHGYGHLAIAAPVVDALAARHPDWRLTLRSRLPPALLRQRIRAPFAHLAGGSDFGLVMHDTLRVDLAASAAAYRAAHADWPRAVAGEAGQLRRLGVDAVLTNVAYLPLAAAARLGLPACSFCSLNWADLFAHFFADQAWAAPIHAEILAAYRSADAFLRVTPGMPMPALAPTAVGTVAALGRRQRLLGAGLRSVLVAPGGIAHRLPLERWPRLPGIRWLVPAAWQVEHPDALVQESFGLAFTDLLASADAVLTKPGYGTFTEAAANATPVLYLRRADWPEQDCLIEWLHEHGRALEIAPELAATGELAAPLAQLWAQPAASAAVRLEAPAIAARVAAVLLRS